MWQDQGIIVVDKPIGKTSAAMVAQVRKLVGMKRVGHCGTLDPFASGVLPIAVGRATGAVAFMSHYDKVYRCRIQLGSATDTMDSEGNIVAQFPGDFKYDEMITPERVERMLREMIGPQEQQAPLYSAVKVDGKPLYKYARAGEEVERPLRKVYVHRADLIHIERRFDQPPVLEVEFATGKGVYVRVLADTLGRLLGCFGYALSLRRTVCGPFEETAAVSTEALFETYNRLNRDPVAMRNYMSREGLLQSTASAFKGIPEVALTAQETRDLAQGRAVKVAACDDEDDALRAFLYRGTLVAVGHCVQGKAKVKRVFMDPDMACQLTEEDM